MSKGISWTKTIEEEIFQIFFTFHRGDPYEFSRRFFWDFVKKNHTGPPMKSEKKCLLEVFLKNLYTMLNAPYPCILRFKPPAPFSFHCQRMLRKIIYNVMMTYEKSISLWCSVKINEN